MPFSDLWDDLADDAGQDQPGEDPVRARADLEANEIVRLKNRARTEKARQQALLSKLKRKLGSAASTASASTSAGGPPSNSDDPTGSATNTLSEESRSWAKRIQEAVFTPRFFSSASATSADPFGDADYQRLGVERARGAMSLMLQVVKTLVGLLRPFARKNSEGQENNFAMAQLLNICVMDDTSTRLKGTAKGDQTNVIYGVMNTIQTVHILYKAVEPLDEQDVEQQSFLIPTPLFCLASQKKEDLYAGYSAYMLLSSAGIGHGLKAMQVPASVCEPARWKVHVLVGDALPTNDALFKLERRILVSRKEERRLALRVKCALHQLSLVRKVAVLSVDSFWTTLVRLSHLFEQFTFKKRFSMALVQILNAPGGFQRVIAAV